MGIFTQIDRFTVTNEKTGIMMLDYSNMGNGHHGSNQAGNFGPRGAAHPPQHHENGRHFGSRDVSEG